MNVIIRTGLVALGAALAMGAAVADDDLHELLGAPDKVKARGAGTYGIAGTSADFEFNARQRRGRPARGTFRHTLVFQGLLIDFSGEVTCMVVDADLGRAWIGGIVTVNNSENPNFTQDIHQPGRDVWFRVLDTGPGSVDADRTTFLGFEGAGGIITSEEYCLARIWPGPPEDAENARTNALTDGFIRVRAIFNDGDDDDDDGDDDD